MLYYTEPFLVEYVVLNLKKTDLFFFTAFMYFFCEKLYMFFFLRAEGFAFYIPK